MTVALAALSLTGYAQSATAAHRILVLGDSISAEYGLARGSGWVNVLAKDLQQRGILAEIHNASISGDTSAGGKARLPKLLDSTPTVVIIELGANDALRGLSLQATEDNLRTMVMQAQQAKAQVLLLGMQVPPNYGPDYTAQFAKMFERIAKQQKVALVPFLLDGVANAPEPMQWFQADRIHPNEKAQEKLARNVWPALQPLLRKRP